MLRAYFISFKKRYLEQLFGFIGAVDVDNMNLHK